MKRIARHIIAGLALLIVATSCSDELLVTDGKRPGGVDKNKMVNVALPFRLSEGMTSNIVTRAEGEDSQLSGVMAFIYAANGTSSADDDELLAWKLFSGPGETLADATGSWTADESDPTRGLLNFYLPTGDVYIYLIGNASGSFLDFFPGIDDEGGISALEEGHALSTRQKFFDNVKPTWTGNFTMTDGHLPLVGMVENEDGLCHIDENGSVSYEDNGGNQVTLHNQLVAGENLDEEHCFVLRRLMAKVTFNFIPGNGVEFIAQK